MGFFDFLDANKRKQKREEKQAAELCLVLDRLLASTQEDAEGIDWFEVGIHYLATNSPDRARDLVDAVRARALAIQADDSLGASVKQLQLDLMANACDLVGLRVLMEGVDGVPANPDILEETKAQGECWKDLHTEIIALMKGTSGAAGKPGGGMIAPPSSTALDTYSDGEDSRSYPLIKDLSKEEALAQFSDFHVAYANHAYSEGSASGFRAADRELIEQGLEKAIVKSGLLFLLSAHHLFNQRLNDAVISAAQAFHACRRPPDGAGPHVYAYYLLYYVLEMRGTGGDPPVQRLIAMNNPGIDVSCADDAFVRDLAGSNASQLSAELVSGIEELLRDRLSPREGATPFPKCW